ncbi:hypothetical protein CRENBAI_023798 [Crenichthys baileyi]|uniref:Uncharacterized protein n=1 Tax=Crenichthys baileyi TaxID=28760 RepID=A0AAV9SNI4_9TELE
MRGHRCRSKPMSSPGGNLVKISSSFMFKKDPQDKLQLAATTQGPPRTTLSKTCPPSCYVSSSLSTGISVSLKAAAHPPPRAKLHANLWNPPGPPLQLPPPADPFFLTIV